MNIKQAKQEIVNTIKAYREKDEMGNYLIPIQKQRPILLIGPPGIGKTAIMEQVAEELSVNLVSYTITHHTRQSAIGLPFISHKEYDGKDMAVTEYTMSEIIASVYDKIEQTGIHEGILFLDEINCVSETLVPTMLQFLQYKTFGSHKVPDGFIIVTAGNPPQYNKAVRDFDIVTLDRVKRIDIEEDLEAFFDYADIAGIHGSIRAYLDIHKDNFYRVKSDIDGKKFVTARGWEDLSQLIRAYEKIGIEIDENVTKQYLQEPEIARDFAMYYALYKKYENIYDISDILKGKLPEDKAKLRKAPFDEKLSILNLIMDRLTHEFAGYDRDYKVQKALQQDITALVKEGDSGTTTIQERLHKKNAELRNDYDKKSGEHLMDKESEMVLRSEISAFEELERQLSDSGTDSGNSDFGRLDILHDRNALDELAKMTIKAWFSGREKIRRERAGEISLHLKNCFRFLSETYGEEQELVLFLTRLDSGHYSLRFIQREGSEEYYKYNQLLLLRDRRAEIVSEILEV